MHPCRALLGSHLDRLSYEDRQAVGQLLVEKVVVDPEGAVAVQPVLPFAEQPVAADQKKKGTPGEFYVLRLKQLHVPATAVQPQNRLGREHRRRQSRQHQHPARQKAALRLWRAFFMALSACVPGTPRLLCVSTIGGHPASHRMLAPCGLYHPLQGADRRHLLSLQGATS
jgi:hypothetical protein